MLMKLGLFGGDRSRSPADARDVRACRCDVTSATRLGKDNARLLLMMFRAFRGEGKTSPTDAHDAWVSVLMSRAKPGW